MILDAKGALDAALLQKAKADFARGAQETAVHNGHKAAVMVHACMKSCFRTDRASLDSIKGVPTDDQTATDTLNRMKALNNVWSNLPNPPGASGPFAVRDITRTAFGKLLDALDARIDDYTKESGLLDKEEANLRGLNATLDDFITHALIQGRAQFPLGTPERALIEAVPTEPSTHKPAQAQITQAESQVEGAMHLKFSAEHATTFKVIHKGPGETEFSEVADVLLPGEYVKAGLPGGMHEYKVVGVNSRGEGPASQPVTIQVAAAEAA
jgi:hypothetical protein